MTARAVESWTLTPLTDFVREASARLVLLMTPAGQVLAQSGFSRAVDVMSAAALGAAIVASTTELAKQLRQPPFAALNHQGHRHGIFLSTFALERGTPSSSSVRRTRSPIGLGPRLNSFTANRARAA